jgi:hypothetical protein
MNVFSRECLEGWWMNHNTPAMVRGIGYHGKLCPGGSVRLGTREVEERERRVHARLVQRRPVRFHVGRRIQNDHHLRTVVFQMLASARSASRSRAALSSAGISGIMAAALLCVQALHSRALKYLSRCRRLLAVPFGQGGFGEPPCCDDGQLHCQNCASNAGRCVCLLHLTEHSRSDRNLRTTELRRLSARAHPKEVPRPSWQDHASPRAQHGTDGSSYSWRTASAPRICRRSLGSSAAGLARGPPVEAVGHPTAPQRM